MSPLAALIVAALSEAEVRSALRDALGTADGEELLPLERAGVLVDKSPRSIRDAGRRGELEIVKIGRSPRVRRSALMAWARPLAVAAAPSSARAIAEHDGAAALRRAALRLARSA